MGDVPADPAEGAGGAATPGSFFQSQPGGQADPAPGGTGTPAAPGATAGDTPAPGTQPAGGSDPAKPDWLLPKYATPEDQAKAYKELYASFSRKTDALRAEVRPEVEEAIRKERGAPETAEAYEYPEGFAPPSEDIDASFRTWAHKNGVGAEAFKELVGEVYGKTQVNFEAEKAKLGTGAEERIGAANRWLNKNVPADHHGELERVMSTASGVALVEALIGQRRESGFAPDGAGSTPTQGRDLSRSAIRERQNDPRFGKDDAYTAEVKADWQAFAKLPPDRQK